MSERFSGRARGRAALACVAAAGIAACAAKQQPRRALVDPDAVEDNRLLPPPGPTFPAAPGKRALLRWASACRDAGARHDPVFRKAGTVVIAWVADRAGDLLQLEFPQDSFRGWEVEPGVTFAECVVRSARAGDVRWSREGSAPLRFHGVEEPASAPTAAPQSQPAESPPSRPTSGAAEAR